MSQGLGAVERAIIDYLSKGTRKFWALSYKTIELTLKKPSFFYFRKEVDIKELVDNTKKSYKSICRAVGSLEKKGKLFKRKLTTINAKNELERQLLKERNANYVVMVKLLRKEAKNSRYPENDFIEISIDKGGQYVKLIHDSKRKL
jgi:hypothetical protein